MSLFQVEDLQDALSSAQRAKRSADSELSEVSDRLQSVEIAKMDAENRISTLQKQVCEEKIPLYLVFQAVS
jgi:predicted  nucleic acid-binding Zn-ribbon protein